MLGRRAVVTGAVAAFATTPAIAVTPPNLRFRIVRERSDIGQHRVTFSSAGGAETALTEVDIVVRLAGIVVFRFGHRFEETFEGDRFVRASSRLERNGRVTTFTARAEVGGIRTDGSDGAHTLPANAAPLTWWDVRRVSRPLFANDTGKLLRLNWTRSAGANNLVHWRCEGDENGDGGYTAENLWVDWQTRAEDGSQVNYVRA